MNGSPPGKHIALSPSQGFAVVTCVPMLAAGTARNADASRHPLSVRRADRRHTTGPRRPLGRRARFGSAGPVDVGDDDRPTGSGRKYSAVGTVGDGIVDR